MKKLFILTTAMVVVLLAACKKEERATVSSNIKAPVMSAPTVGTSIVVTPADSTQQLKVKWSSADYGVQAVVTYFVQIGTSGSNFAKRATLGSTNNVDTLSFTYGALNNSVLNTLGLPANAASPIEMRVGSTIYGKDTVYSATTKLNVTTYKELAPPQLYVPGDYQGWNPAAAAMIYPVTTFAYEGYVYITNTNQFKFTTAPDFNHINYGDAGGGKLTTNGNADGVKVAQAGYYKLNVDISALTYSAVLINSFGVIGTATPHAWDSSTPMTYNQGTKTWSVTVALVPGALKFRANDAWDINYGPADSNALSGNLIQTDGAITINTAGNYTVTIDMSQNTPKKYLYTVVKN
ncbi:SusE domain-containing protein [Mucilaginibacter jinjuensis]|uniref:SusE domain-containing protein n=1 Tax=Mucilaginibacter jinjuensis TaxID=1176721 RepID=A0ABY7TCX7_9SPHI|nr:SusE domain-containing protein [Mucilaginibacter jinjuensis]WCT14193.1 SusE domain-containing protein [Mucilaginibacter jinjuensis]